MAKIKLNIKNTQIAQAINLGKVKEKLEEKKVAAASKSSSSKTPKALKPEGEGETLPKEESPRIRARSRSAFTEKGEKAEEVPLPQIPEPLEQPEAAFHEDENAEKLRSRGRKKGSEAPFFEHEEVSSKNEGVSFVESKEGDLTPHPLETPPPSEKHTHQEEVPPPPPTAIPPSPPLQAQTPKAHDEPKVKLGPTGKHISDFFPHKYPSKAKGGAPEATPSSKQSEEEKAAAEKLKNKGKVKGTEPETPVVEAELADDKKGGKVPKFKEFRDLKPARKKEQKAFEARDRHGFGETDDEFSRHRKKRMLKNRYIPEEPVTVRPTQLSIRIPISIKDLASEMKLKASELIAKMFLHGAVVNINSLLEDETTIQLIGQDFGCNIRIDTTEEERIRITDKTISEEIEGVAPQDLVTRAPVVAFMGHVDHGKTSLIDAIRKSNRAASEAGAITQHIGAFKCSTAVGDITILDTPGHEAFSAMRERGAEVTDIVVLVVAGDEGIKQQTLEALQHAKAAKVTIVVAINKSDKPNFNPETVYRQLAEQELLPEVWGGQTITVNCSALTGQGIPQLLEMLALQAEVLELKANPLSRARGSVLESEMHKGLGAATTVLVQNGTLRLGDAIVFGGLWGRVKTMRNEFGKELKEAPPSTPVEITGLSGLPGAGEEFIVVKNEKEAREIAEARSQGFRQKNLLMAKKVSLESVFQQASSEIQKKIFPVLLRADVQGSLEALKIALQKIQSQKVDLNIIFAGVGEVSESDIQLAAASKATIIGFHTQIESHADALVKQLGVQVKMHDVIYHAIDDVKVLMASILDKLPQENEKGKAEVKTTFKSSQHGLIAGCIVTEGSIHRNHQIRVKRNQEVIWRGPVGSLRRVKDDVREVQKGLECGILLNGFNEVEVGDILEAYDVTYISQEL